MECNITYSSTFLAKRLCCGSDYITDVISQFFLLHSRYKVIEGRVTPDLTLSFLSFSSLFRMLSWRAPSKWSHHFWGVWDRLTNSTSRNGGSDFCIIWLQHCFCCASYVWIICSLVTLWCRVAVHIRQWSICSGGRYECFRTEDILIERTLLGSFRRSPGPLVGWGGNTVRTPLPIAFFSRRLNFVSTLIAPRFLGTTNKKFWIRLCCSGGGARMNFLQGARNLKLRHCL